MGEDPRYELYVDKVQKQFASGQQLRDYDKAIKPGTPLSLSEISFRVDQYSSQREFMAGMLMIFQNSMRYNKPGTKIHKNAEAAFKELTQLCPVSANPPRKRQRLK